MKHNLLNFISFNQNYYIPPTTAACNDMIVQLPRPELMKLDKTLRNVLRCVVTMKTTQITKVKPGQLI